MFVVVFLIPSVPFLWASGGVAPPDTDDLKRETHSIERERNTVSHNQSLVYLCVRACVSLGWILQGASRLGEEYDDRE